jgi:hypothetical protein
MGDDVQNGIYKIEMSDDSSLKDLIDVLLNGGNGNSWPIPEMSEIGWIICSNIGELAVVSADKKTIEYCDKNADTKLSILGIEWVFAEREGKTIDIPRLGRIFE